MNNLIKFMYVDELRSLENLEKAFGMMNMPSLDVDHISKNILMFYGRLGADYLRKLIHKRNKFWYKYRKRNYKMSK